jgi:hypothetical protein
MCSDCKTENNGNFRIFPFAGPNNPKLALDRQSPLPYGLHFMIMQRKSAFSRRGPDLVTEELVAVLKKKSSFEFKQLFDMVHEQLRARNAASGGEEMLRLRAYEKLQNLLPPTRSRFPSRTFTPVPPGKIPPFATHRACSVGVSLFYSPAYVIIGFRLLAKESFSGCNVRQCKADGRRV